MNSFPAHPLRHERNGNFKPEGRCNMENIRQNNETVKRDPRICRARRHAAKHGMRMLRQKDGSYKLTRLIPPRYSTITVISGLSPEHILDFCWWFDKLAKEAQQGRLKSYNFEPYWQSSTTPAPAIEDTLALPFPLPAQSESVN